MIHISSYDSYNESLVSFLMGNDAIAKRILDRIPDLSPNEITKVDESPLCISYSWEMYDDQILYNKLKVEVVKYTKTVLLMVNDREIRSSRWLRNKVWERIEDIYES